jgi:hypothetical protein
LKQPGAQVENVGEERNQSEHNSYKVEPDRATHAAIRVSPNTELQQNGG